MNRMVLVFILTASMAFAQSKSNSSLEQGSYWLGSKIGFTFYSDDLAALDQNLTAGQEVENTLKIQLLPAINYALADNFFVGAHIGFGYLGYSHSNPESKQRFQNYTSGLHLRHYFLQLVDDVHFFGEVGGNYNYLYTKSSDSGGYLKSYFDVGVTVMLADNWGASILLKDIFFYYSDSPNFENRNGLGSSKPLKQMIDFPFFSIMYRLD